MASRKFGHAAKKCTICGTHDRMIRSYRLNVCGRCFREVAAKIGFKKYS